MGRSTKGWADKQVFTIIANGSVLMELSEFEAHPEQAMVTMYHLDGDRLMLTHYCAAKNQPRLVATSVDAEGRLNFTFLDATNISSRDVGHMGSARYRLIDEEHFSSQWTFFQDGEGAWMEEITYERMTHPHVATIEAFRAARRAGDLETARQHLGDDPRVWYDAREGAGSPWKLGEGRWKTWDDHFNGSSDMGPWHVEGSRVWAVVEEMNDYFRLIERRDMPRYRITYFIEDDGRLGGYMISPADPDAPNSPMVSRFDEFEAWARVNEPTEWAYLRPGGRLDPTEDRARRTRALANRWRSSVGLPPIE